MVAISQVIKLKEKGYSNREIAQKFNVTPRAIDKALVKAKRDGLWNGKSGTSKYFEDGTAEHPFTIENIMREKKQERREVLPDGSLKPKPFPKYRCLKKKCRMALTPLDEVTFEQRDDIRKELLSRGYTHICLKCLTVYERERKPISEESANCPNCGSEMHFVEYEGELIDVFWCEECKEGFKAEEEELKKIEKYEQKRKQPSSKQISKAMQETE